MTRCDVFKHVILGYSGHLECQHTASLRQVSNTRPNLQPMWRFHMGYPKIQQVHNPMSHLFHIKLAFFTFLLLDEAWINPIWRCYEAPRKPSEMNIAGHSSWSTERGSAAGLGGADVRSRQKNIGIEPEELEWPRTQEIQVPKVPKYTSWVSAADFFLLDGANPHQSTKNWESDRKC